MKILLAAGVYPPQVGGPSYYAFALNEEFKKNGEETTVVAYSSFLKLPSGVRHFSYLVRLFISGYKSDVILGFDSMSVGLPAVIVGKILRKKVVLRLGGDFLWEHYVERTKEKIPLPQFYEQKRLYTWKEKVIYMITNFVVQGSDTIVFSTPWLRDIFISAYQLELGKTQIIENAIQVVPEGKPFEKKNYIWAGRRIFLKNTELLKSAFYNAEKFDPSIHLELLENIPHRDLMRRIEKCYAIIYPSLSEVSPNFALEALALGKPSIVTKYTGYAEILKDVALFVDPLSGSDITEKILFLADEKNYQTISSNIRTFSHTHSYADIASEYVTLFKKLI